MYYIDLKYKQLNRLHSIFSKNFIVKWEKTLSYNVTETIIDKNVHNKRLRKAVFVDEV